MKATVVSYEVDANRKVMLHCNLNVNPRFKTTGLKRNLADVTTVI